MPELTSRLSYAEAVNAALHRALAEDGTTLLFGEDVAVPGGVFGVTKGLRQQFGERVFDTPISESAILGGAIGAAMFGARPIAEIMWADFSLVALDQLVNQAANVRYVSRGRVGAPITVRTQQGHAPGACAQHSQNLEAFFAHVPGLRVCMPATHQDAYDLLLSSIWCDDPVVVIENRTLYHAGRQDIRIGGQVRPIGGARIRRPGADVTVVTWGAMLHRVLDAADRLAALGFEAEVVDARWIRPLDLDTVLASVKRTRRLVVAHEAHVTGGVGGEIVAAVAEAGIPLRRPPIRVGAPPTRIPAAPALAQAVIPSADTIAEALALAVSPGETR
ncbi:transketolase C-terminal domain-containing protein [Nonomuraea sp. B19D2]|uniref:alpha-ketoacid dehydrogenase subunit beta n=1 Tax=Nonomuraea sp. B19D2 TaxID=3159561 RepID=UPI0032DB9DE6